MFPDEPEGKSFEDLQEHLGAAAALGTAIEIELVNGKRIEAYVNNSQNHLPKYLELLLLKNEVHKKVVKIHTKNISWFQLKRYGRSESYTDEEGVPTAKLPIVIINAKKVTGCGKIVNTGLTSIRSEVVDFEGEIISNDKK